MVRGAQRGTLGIYCDDVFRVQPNPGRAQLSADEAFQLFACAVGAHFDAFVLFGRTLYRGPPGHHLLPATAQLAELPYYESLRRPWQVLRASVGTIRGMWRGLGRVDAVWALGPNPYGILLIGLGLLRRRRVILGVRQDTLVYYRHRLPGRRAIAALPLAHAMDWLYRMLARRLPITVVGEELGRRYRGTRRSVLPMTVTLVSGNDIVPARSDRKWEPPLRLLAVGRIDREKNPSLLVEALAELEREEPGRYLLRWAGRGPLAEAVRERAGELGIGGRLELCGYVPFGPALLALYRDAHILVHVSLTEGVPQVIVEALASATAIVATDVGGVREALDQGRAGMLVPPADREALVRAIRRIADDANLRERLVARGLELARDRTLEAQAGRVAEFLAGRSYER
jgi:glycosyltransferase involved in cell wall biosynthesis